MLPFGAPCLQLSVLHLQGTKNQFSTKSVRRLHKDMHLPLNHVHPRSPDLNPVEMYWAWLRKKLRKMDLDDLLAKRPAIQRAGLKTRVRALVNQRNLRVSSSYFFLPGAVSGSFGQFRESWNYMSHLLGSTSMSCDVGSNAWS